MICGWERPSCAGVDDGFDDGELQEALLPGQPSRVQVSFSANVQNGVFNGMRHTVMRKMVSCMGQAEIPDETGMRLIEADRDIAERSDFTHCGIVPRQEVTGTGWSTRLGSGMRPSDIELQE
jgi:hypothetical protein